MAKTPRFEWVGGERCLDFNNTAAWRSTGPYDDRLGSREDILEWGAGAGLMADSPPQKASPRILKDAVALRATLHRILSPLSRWHAPAPEDLAALNEFLRRALSGVRLARGKGTFRWDFSGSAGDLDPILAAVVWSAARLLESADLSLLRECADPECGWLFVDRSRRKNRRWCEMRECGSRAKARRYYLRHRSARNRGNPSPRAPLGRESTE
ncbi:MAG: CGNR zinc finger domain-containing protein [Thermoanaerobaculia bacterium]